MGTSFCSSLRSQHDEEAIQVRFNVEEPLTCYRAEVQGDGGRCYEDSCVEVFIKALDNPNEYFNFEFNSKAFCLAAKGPSRSERVLLIPLFIQKFTELDLPSDSRRLYLLGAKVKIPFSILGKSKDSLLK